ncbi:MAG TPA: SEC-C metal-binding domain-containing protein, partial [Bacteroidia bacterium]|nr:SEC-C metal-binding domain-containing protein [Bacteroidia bacterium]
SVDISNMFMDVAETIVSEFHGADGDYEAFKLELFRVLATEPPVTDLEFQSMQASEISQMVFEKVQANYLKKGEHLSKDIYPFLKNVFENNQRNFENIQIPVSDGIHMLRVVAKLEDAYKSAGKSVITEMEKTVLLSVLDEEWKEHLREMDDLKQSVRNAVYEQKDPLLIYKFESFELFRTMLVKMNKNIASFLMKCLPVADAPGGEVQEARVVEEEVDLQTNRTGDEAPTGANGKPAPPKAKPAVAEKRIGRNDPCPCGSGKKYKNCHGVGKV